ncbi:MAG: RsmE family RNA methyltransferase [Bryobacteraceae bacterium]
MSRRRFFVDEVRNGQAEIPGGRASHLTSVLRVEPGQKFELSDNKNVYLAEVELARKQRVVFRILERLPLPDPSVRLHLFAALTKFDRFEWMLEKATELGVETIVPVEAARCEKGLERAAFKRVDRWKRILLEASQQSRRVQIPGMEEPWSLADAMRCDAAARFVLLETAGAPAILTALPEHRAVSDVVAVLAGPEGGWTEEEAAAFSNSGWRAVSLGPRILRAETAALAALAVLGAAWR